MFVNETHSYYIVLSLDENNSSAAKKKDCFEKAVAHMGATPLSCCKSIWALNEVIYSSSDDIFDILNTEMLREGGKDCELVSGKDKLLISEYVDDNTFSL
ncbi:MAG: hypothetical protein IJD28_08465 [Deferribacterales bacterium]|nr:hypothetical protein [Deferribacterales bacterium]